MADAVYDYVKEINATQLTKEIRASSITTALDYINTIGENVSIYMKATLSSADVTTLNTVVSDHVPEVFGDGERYSLDSKLVVHETSRPFGTTTTFTSRGDVAPDSTAVGTDVGSGTLMLIDHHTGNDADQTVYMDLNIKNNPTYIHEGYLIWNDASADLVNLDIVSRVTNYTSDTTGTNYQLVNGYLIVPAAPGTGNISVDAEDIRLVEMPVERDTGKRPAGYWNAEFDSTDTLSFVNITPVYDGKGIYNMFGTEIVFARFVNDVPLVRYGFLNFQTADVDELGQGMRIRLRAFTHTDGTDQEDHNWTASIALAFDRVKTC